MADQSWVALADPLPSPLSTHKQRDLLQQVYRYHTVGVLGLKLGIFISRRVPESYQRLKD